MTYDLCRGGHMVAEYPLLHTPSPWGPSAHLYWGGVAYKSEETPPPPPCMRGWEPMVEQLGTHG